MQKQGIAIPDREAYRPVTRSLDGAEAGWRAVNNPSASIRQPAVANAVELAEPR